MTTSHTPFSFEFFPPSTDKGHTALIATAQSLAELSPDYFSVTYGAGGSTRDRTLSTIDAVTSVTNIEVAPHLSCIGDDKAKIADLLDYYRSQGIRRIVALRGDLPSGQVGMGELPFARDLVEFIRTHSGDYFRIEVAAYPEMHPQAKSFDADIDSLKAKFDAGADAAITQFFFNPDSFLFLRDKIRAKGVDKPLIAGIMPIIKASNLIRFADSCGADIPRYIRKQLADYGDDIRAVRQFGREVVTKMCERLIAEEVDALHFYSMNKTEPVKSILSDLNLVTVND